MLPLNIDLSIGNVEEKEDYRLSMTKNGEYAVYLNTEKPLFWMVRDKGGHWLQSAGEPLNKVIVDKLGEELDYIDQMEFEFPLVYEGGGVVCRVAMGESGFGVIINNDLVAEVYMLDNGLGWEVVNGGPLDLEALEEIGRQIEKHTR